MKKDVRITGREGYVEVYTAGDRSLDSADELFARTTAFCKKANTFRILLISKTGTQFEPAESLNLIDLYRKHRVDERYRIAVVELNESAYDVFDLSILVARYWKFEMKMFRDEHTALAWLLDDDAR